MRDFIGQGLGKYYLQWTIDKSWSYSPKRFWLHTCTKDHPAALPNYLKAGFAIYKVEVTSYAGKPAALLGLDPPRTTRISTSGPLHNYSCGSE
jgi:hypothetical protein